MEHLITEGNISPPLNTRHPHRPLKSNRLLGYDALAAVIVPLMPASVCPEIMHRNV